MTLAEEVFMEDGIAETLQMKLADLPIPGARPRRDWPAQVPGPEEAKRLLQGKVAAAGPVKDAIQRVAQRSAPLAREALFAEPQAFDLAVLEGALLTRLRIEIAAGTYVDGAAVDAEALGELLGEIDAVLEVLRVAPEDARLAETFTAERTALVESSTSLMARAAAPGVSAAAVHEHRARKKATELERPVVKARVALAPRAAVAGRSRVRPLHLAAALAAIAGLAYQASRIVERRGAMDEIAVAASMAADPAMVRMPVEVFAGAPADPARVDALRAIAARTGRKLEILPSGAALLLPATSRVQ